MTEVDLNSMDEDAQRDYCIGMCIALQKELNELEIAKLHECSFCELYDYEVLLELRVKALKGLPLTEADKAHLEVYNMEWYEVLL
jgi:hypothetical protein